VINDTVQLQIAVFRLLFEKKQMKNFTLQVIDDTLLLVITPTTGKLDSSFRWNDIWGL